MPILCGLVFRQAIIDQGAMTVLLCKGGINLLTRQVIGGGHFIGTSGFRSYKSRRLPPHAPPARSGNTHQDQHWQDRDRCAMRLVRPYLGQSPCVPSKGST